jgi:general secretion pathway protein K
MTPARKQKLLRRRKRQAKKRGIALIMVLGTLAVLTVMLAEFQMDISATVASATAERDGVQAEYMARSAVNLSRLLIAMEPTMRQGIAPLFAFMKRSPPQLPVWEFADRLLSAFNDKSNSESFAKAVGADLGTGKNLGMPGGSFELVIVDEDSKINVNLGASNDIAHIRLAKQLMGLTSPPQYNSLFEQRDPTGTFHDRLAICSAMLDWADMDEQAFSCDLSANASSGSAVEDAYYQLLAKPYRRKNAPYDSLAELHMVRGVGDDFWSTFVDPDPKNPQKRVLTVWGQGTVNVNSANAQTLLGVICSGAPAADICVDASQAQLFLMGVTMAKGISMGAPLFGSTAEFVTTMKGQGMLGPLLTKMGMKPVKFLSESEFAKSITTESKVFSIHAIGVVKGYKRETRLSVDAVVDFRNAPQPTAAPVAGAAAAPLPGASGSSAIPGALAPATGGTVLDYRID